MTNLYRDDISNPKYNAQRNLSGRTHYVDDSTLRYFHARILSAGEVADGLLFAIVESSAADMRNQSRIYRGVVFDLFGETVYRPDIEQSQRNPKAARYALAAFLRDFDAKAHTLAAIERQRKAQSEELDYTAAKVAALGEVA